MALHMCTSFCARFGCSVLAGPGFVPQPALEFTTYEGRHRPTGED